MSTRATNRWLALPAAGFIALCVSLHGCGGGGGGGGGGTPLPMVPPPSGFVSTTQVPANSAVNVSRMPVILIGFNDIVNPATMNDTTVSLNLGTVPVPSTLTYIACSNQIELIPNAALQANLEYNVSLT